MHGYPPHYVAVAPPSPRPRINGWAPAALTVSILGLFTLGIVSVLGVILGHIALLRTRHGRSRGVGLAAAALGISYPMLLFAVVFWFGPF